MHVYQSCGVIGHWTLGFISRQNARSLTGPFSRTNVAVSEPFIARGHQTEHRRQTADACCWLENKLDIADCQTGIKVGNVEVGRKNYVKS